MAVTVAVELLLTVPVVTLKVAVAAPAATVTEAGTVRTALLLDKVTSAPPVGAAPDRVTVQVEELEPLRLEGLQDKELTVGKETPEVTVPPTPVRPMEEPVAEAATVLVTPMDMLVTPEATVRLMTATVPFKIVLALMPEARQV